MHRRSLKTAMHSRAFGFSFVPVPPENTYIFAVTKCNLLPVYGIAFDICFLSSCLLPTWVACVDVVIQQGEVSVFRVGKEFGCTVFELHRRRECRRTKCKVVGEVHFGDFRVGIVPYAAAFRCVLACGEDAARQGWKSHATLTLLAKQDCPLWLQYDCPFWPK